MNCETAGRLISKSWDSELSAKERQTLDKHLGECVDCREQLQIWQRYEHKISRYYQAHRLGEEFVQTVHQRIAFLKMESAEPKRPEITGSIQVPAIRWLQPLGMAAGILLAILLFVFRHDPYLGRWLAGHGFLMTGPADTAMELGRGTYRLVRPGDVVWTTGSQRLKIQLPGEIPVSLSERGLMSLAVSGSAPQSTARLYSGKVELNAPGSRHNFAFNTAAGRIQGEAGRIDVTAEWIALSERKWKAGSARESWTEGWQAVPVARINVEEGIADVASMTGAERELSPGQSAILSYAFVAPIVSAPSETGSEISVAPLAESGSESRIISEVLPDENQPRIATTFVNIPLSTILSSVADVQPSQLEMDSAVKASPLSIRVIRPLTATAENVLSAVAGFSGVTYEKAEHAMSMDVVDAPHAAVPENDADAGSPQLTLEMEGSSVKLLKGSGVRMSVLAKALESVVNESVETVSADWPLGEFELRDIPREKIREALTGKLGLRFQKESRNVPHYRIRAIGGKQSPRSGMQENSTAPKTPRRTELRAIHASQDKGSLETYIQRSFDLDGDFQDSGTSWSQGGKIAKQGRSVFPRLAAPGSLPADEEASVMLNSISAWLNSLQNMQGQLFQRNPLPASGSMVPKPANGSPPRVSGQSAATGVTPVETGSLGMEIAKEQARRALVLLERRAAEAETALRLVFPPSALEGLTRLTEGQPLSLMLIGLLNDSDSPAAVRINCRNAAGKILDSSDVAIRRRSFFIAGAPDLFPGCGSQAEVAYIDAESSNPISGLQLLYLGGELKVLAAASPNRQLYIPWPHAQSSDVPLLQARLSLTNTSELHTTAWVASGLADGSFSGTPMQVELAPHQTLVVPVKIADAEAFMVNPASPDWMVRVEATQTGLVGFLAFGELDDQVSLIIPASGTSSCQWDFNTSGSTAEIQVWLFNSNESAALVRLLQSCPESASNRLATEIELAAWGGRLVALPPSINERCSWIHLLSALPIQALRVDDPYSRITAP